MSPQEMRERVVSYTVLIDAYGEQIDELESLRNIAQKGDSGESINDETLDKEIDCINDRIVKLEKQVEYLSKKVDTLEESVAESDDSNNDSPDNK